MRGGSKFLINMFCNIEGFGKQWEKIKSQNEIPHHGWASTKVMCHNTDWRTFKNYTKYVFIRNPYHLSISTVIFHNGWMPKRINMTYNQFLINSYYNKQKFQNNLANIYMNRSVPKDMIVLPIDSFMENINFIVKKHKITEVNYEDKKSYTKYLKPHEYKGKNPLQLTLGELFAMYKKGQVPYYEDFYDQNYLDLVFNSHHDYFLTFKYPININNLIPKNAKKGVGFFILQNNKLVPY